MENEMAKEIWSRMNTEKKCPGIEFKQGGYSAAYYPATHKVKLRTNVWNKLDMGQKRLLMIHELIHATGKKHKCVEGYLGASDELSREVYYLIYGNDEHIQKAVSLWQEIARQLTK